MNGSDRSPDRAYEFDPSLGFPTASTTQALSDGIEGLLSGQLTVDQIVENPDASWGN